MRAYVVCIGVLLAALSLSGCQPNRANEGEQGAINRAPTGDAPTAPAAQATKTGGDMMIIPVQEGTSYRAAASGQSNITWIEATAAGPEWDANAGTQQVRQAIRDSAQRLAAVDYAALSLPDFVTYTRALKLQPSHFQGGEPQPDAFGTDAQGNRWVLYMWEGPEFPQHPERPLVHRWVYVYALYSLANDRVTLLLPGIQGEVYE